MQNSLKIFPVMLLVSTAVAACGKTESAATDTGAAVAQAVTGDRTADAAWILGADSAWLRHVMAKNVDSIMTYYTPDAVSYGFGGPPASGTDQLRSAYTEFVKANMTNPSITPATVKFSDDGTMAFDHGTYSMTVTSPGGKPENVTGGYVNVWRKVDGQWKLAAEISTPIATK